MSEQAGGGTDILIDVIVLAFDHSELSGAVSSDALRCALEEDREALFAGGALDLGALFELLEGRPGFHPKTAEPPLCRIKSWERALGLDVRLPDHLERLPAPERDRLAADCPVPPAMLRQVLRGAAPTPDAGEHAGPSSPKPERPATERPPPKRKRQRERPRPLLFVLGGLALASFLVAGFLIWRGLNPAAGFESLPASVGDLPAEALERRGREAGATLTDPSWLDRPSEARREQMAAALRSLSSQQIEVLFLRDPKGAIRATAQWQNTPTGRRIAVKFR